MLASIIVTTVSLIALQVMLVVKVADGCRRTAGRAEGRNERAGGGNGRFAGIA